MRTPILAALALLSAASVAEAQAIYPYVGPYGQPMYESPPPYQPPPIFWQAPAPAVIFQPPPRAMPHPHGQLPSWVPQPSR